MEHSDYQSLRVGGGNCAHVRALARVPELVVVVVCNGVKADSEVSEAGCDSPGTHPAQKPGLLNDHKAFQQPANTLVTIPLTIQLPYCIPTGKSRGKIESIN